MAVDSNGYLSGWCLRTAGCDMENFALISDMGYIEYSERRADCKYPVTEDYVYDGVRPALWINLI